MYEQTNVGIAPVMLSFAREYLKCPSTLDNAIVSGMLEMATSYGESFAGRDFRANTYILHLDEFIGDRICLRRSPVASITSITRLVSGSPIAVSSSDYYLKSGTRYSSAVLEPGASWPTDQDEKEHTIAVNFKTSAYKNPELYRLAILKHVAFAYENRGDDAIPLGSNNQRTQAILGYEGALASGAIGLYQTIRIPRI